jgi:hypothetical protein
LPRTAPQLEQRPAPEHDSRESQREGGTPIRRRGARVEGRWRRRRRRGRRRRRRGEGRGRHVQAHGEKKGKQRKKRKSWEKEQEKAGYGDRA